MQYKNKIIQLIHSKDADSQSIGLNILKNKVDHNTILEYYDALFITSTLYKNSIISEWLENKFQLDTTNLSLIDYASKYYNQFTIESKQELFKVLNKKMYQIITKNHALDNTQQQSDFQQIEQLKFLCNKD